MEFLSAIFNVMSAQPVSILIVSALSCLLMLAMGRPLIGWLKHRKGMKWAPREDTPDTHLQKAGVPSMGGIGIIASALLAYAAVLLFTISGQSFFSSFFNPTTKVSSPQPAAVTLIQLSIFPCIVLLHAVLGYVDDHSKATNKGGISSKQKLVGQIFLAALFLSSLYFIPIGFGAKALSVSVASATLGSWPLLIGALLIIIGTSNAVNLTDGIDGLAAGLSIQVAFVFACMIFDYQLSGPAFNSAILFWPALGGACLGFLAFNKYPAKVFMGDTGSLALGAALGAGAILTRTVWLLPFVGFIFYVEMFSVIAQVLYFKYTRRKFGEGKRLFKRAPLHHHFELSGWSEWRVVATFWGVNLVTTIIGLVLWKMGILPRFP